MIFGHSNSKYSQDIAGCGEIYYPIPWTAYVVHMSGWLTHKIFLVSQEMMDAISYKPLPLYSCPLGLFISAKSATNFCIINTCDICRDLSHATHLMNFIWVYTHVLSLWYQKRDKIFIIVSPISQCTVYQLRGHSHTPVHEVLRAMCTDWSSWPLLCLRSHNARSSCLNPIMTWIIWFWYITKRKFASEIPKREVVNHAL